MKQAFYFTDEERLLDLPEINRVKRDASDDDSKLIHISDLAKLLQLMLILLYYFGCVISQK